MFASGCAGGGRAGRLATPVHGKAQSGRDARHGELHAVHFHAPRKHSGSSASCIAIRIISTARVTTTSEGSIAVCRQRNSKQRGIEARKSTSQRALDQGMVHYRSHRSVRNFTPDAAFSAFKAVLDSAALGFRHSAPPCVNAAF